MGEVKSFSWACWVLGTFSSKQFTCQSGTFGGDVFCSLSREKHTLSSPIQEGCETLCFGCLFWKEAQFAPPKLCLFGVRIILGRLFWETADTEKAWKPSPSYSCVRVICIFKGNYHLEEDLLCTGKRRMTLISRNSYQSRRQRPKSP